MPKRKSHGDQVKDKPKIRTVTTNVIPDANGKGNSCPVSAADQSVDRSVKQVAETGMYCPLDRQDSVVIKDVDVYVERCREILHRISHFLEKHPQPSDQQSMDRWRYELGNLKEKTDLPETIISVVGVTGSGKSTLVNALVDHSDLLPVSGIEACTAVAVEVTGNGSKETYEAEIKFLSKEEWLDELVLLRNLLTDEEGNIHPVTNYPDAEAAKDKLTAVYGRYKSGDDWYLYTRENDVTKRLGDTETIEEKEAEAFQEKIDQYIKSNSGGNPQYWPIVRRVRIKIPNCEVCKKRVTIVDLPGTGDSNAARDRVAENFLKHCHAMFVVAEVKRAVADKKAKELLGPRFRQQLLFDGQYNTISFICTHTDVVSPREVKRELDLDEKLESIQENIRKISALIDKLKTEKAAINEIAEQEERLKKEKMKEKVICIKGRNEHCKARLKEDFKIGLKETRSGGTTADNDEEKEKKKVDDVCGVEDMDNLEVFCVSAAQYLSLTGNREDDKVFPDPLDTEIPQLKQFVQNIASKRQSRALIDLMRSMRIFVGEICRCTKAGGEHMRRHATHVKYVSMEKFCRDLKEELRNMKERIGTGFDRLIRDLEKGAELADTQAEETQEKWGSTYFWNTYHTTCQGNGYYRSREKGQVDFNGDLAEPMYTSIKGSWDAVFNCQLEKYLRGYVESVMVLLMKFSKDVSKGVKTPGKERDEASRTYLDQILNVCGEKIDCSIKNMLQLVKTKQKSINRVSTEKVKERMLPAYNKCKSEKGKYMFRRMKDHMKSHVLENRNSMFHDAQAAMKEELRKLETEITKKLEGSVDMLESSLPQSVFEPPSGNELVSDYLREARCIEAEIDQLCREANIPESLTSPKSQSAADEMSQPKNEWLGSWN